ncbi:MAG: mechanosensitive ion channel family protein [Acholeplasma sp.]|jgi:small conductance mechanosensitive channel|nr:MAG: mechanosensitive ion channel family protein [Acholeplasma sp.]
MNQKERTKKERIEMIVTAVVIGVFILLGSLSGILFPGTAFANIIDNSIGKFFDLIGFFKNSYVNILESVTILIFVWILNFVLLFLVKLLTKKGHRAETLGILFTSIVKYISILIGLLLILSAWGVQTPTLLAGAGIAGLAVSFGAQGLLQDVFSGLSIIFERQFVVGDIVEVGNFRGTVKQIGPRNTRVQDIAGNVLIIANSDIREIVNLSAELSVAISDISVEYGADLIKVEEVIKEYLPEMKKSIPEIVEGPIYKGVNELADSSVVVRIAAKCEEKNRYDVTRALNRELKLLFDRKGINIPFPQVVVHQANKEHKE